MKQNWKYFVMTENGTPFFWGRSFLCIFVLLLGMVLIGILDPILLSKESMATLS